MIPREQLAAYLDDALDDARRTALDRELETDAEALRFVVEQRAIERVVRSALLPAIRRLRLRQSVLAAIAATPAQELRARVIAEIVSDRSIAPTRLEATSAVRAANPNDPRRGVLEWLAESWRQIVNLCAEGKARAWSLAALATVAVALTLGPWLADVGRTSRVEAQVGIVAEVVGAPTLRHGQGAAAIEAVRGTPVRLGDRLETGDADRAEVRFHDGTVLRLAFNTTIELPFGATNQQPKPATLLRPAEVLLRQGQAWTKVAKLTNAQAYAIRTDAATAIARGTEFFVRLQRVDATSTNSPFSTVLTVKEGAVDFTNSLGSVRATAMMESTATANSAPTEPKRLTALPLAGRAREGNWPILTAPLTASVAAERLVPGGGWVGMVLRTFTNSPTASALPGAAPSLEVRVARVERGSPADLAGIRPGDHLLAVNEWNVAAAAEIEQSILATPEARLNLRLRRGEEEWLAELTVGSRSSHLPGPTLSPRQRERLVEVTRRLLTRNAATAEREVGGLRDPAVRAAAENNLGVRCETEDRLGAAIRAYGRAVRADPAVPLYRFNLGLALRLMGSYERAAEEVGEAVRLAPRSTAARQRFAEIQSVLGRGSHALALTEAALQDDPNSHGLWELKAQLLWRQQRLHEARDAASQAIQLEPSCPVAHAYLGGVLQDLGQMDPADAAVQTAIALDPFLAPLHYQLGMIRQARGQPRLAVESLRRAINLEPDRSELFSTLGSLLGDLGDPQQAEATYRRCLEIDPENRPALHNLAEIHRERGTDLDQAEALYRRVLALDPDSASSLSGLGLVLARRGNFAEAERLLREACRLAPTASAMQNNLGEVLRHSGQPDAAAEAYRRAIQLDPDNLSPYNNLAILQATRREFAEAEKAFRALVDRAPSAVHLVNLANVCGELGKLEEAESLLRRALTLQPDDYRFACSLADFLATHQIKLDEALTLARRTVQAEPANPRFLGTLGWIHLLLGDLDAAETTLQRALDLAGEHPSAGDIRENLAKARAMKPTRQSAPEPLNP